MPCSDYILLVMGIHGRIISNHNQIVCFRLITPMVV